MFIKFDLNDNSSWISAYDESKSMTCFGRNIGLRAISCIQPSEVSNARGKKVKGSIYSSAVEHNP